MATPPEDDFPTKTTAEAIREDRDRTPPRPIWRVNEAHGASIDRLRSVLDWRHRLLSAFGAIGPRAQFLLVKIAERLAHGARQYGGDFDDKPRDWNKEALEEHMDAVVYMAMACMERDEAKAADKARAEAACRMPPVDMRHYNIDPRDGAAPVDVGPSWRQVGTPGSNGTGRLGEAAMPTPGPQGPIWPLTTPGEDWEKTRDGCG